MPAAPPATPAKVAPFSTVAKALQARCNVLNITTRPMQRQYQHACNNSLHAISNAVRKVIGGSVRVSVIVVYCPKAMPDLPLRRSIAQGRSPILDKTDSRPLSLNDVHQ